MEPQDTIYCCDNGEKKCKSHKNCLGIVDIILLSLFTDVIGLIIGAALSTAILGALAAIIVLAIILGILLILTTILLLCNRKKEKKNSCCFKC